jgi:hypothetical protein
MISSCRMMPLVRAQPRAQDSLRTSTHGSVPIDDRAEQLEPLAIKFHQLKLADWCVVGRACSDPDARQVDPDLDKRLRVPSRSMGCSVCAMVGCSMPIRRDNSVWVAASRCISQAITASAPGKTPCCGGRSICLISRSAHAIFARASGRAQAFSGHLSEHEKQLLPSHPALFSAAQPPYAIVQRKSPQIPA